MDAILFDLDGTLLDSRRLYAAAYRHAFTSELPEPPTFEQFAARRPSSERFFLVEWYGEALGGRLHDRMLERYEAEAGSLLGGFFDGVREMLEAVRARGLKTAIVTGKSRRAYDVTRAHVDLTAFEVVVVEEDVAQPKPDPEGILRAHAALGGGDAVYVGDTPMDIDAAMRAGLQPAAALWSRSASDRARVRSSLGGDVWALLEPRDLMDRV